MGHMGIPSWVPTQDTTYLGSDIQIWDLDTWCGILDTLSVPDLWDLVYLVSEVVWSGLYSTSGTIVWSVPSFRTYGTPLRLPTVVAML